MTMPSLLMSSMSRSTMIRMMFGRFAAGAVYGKAVSAKRTHNAARNRVLCLDFIRFRRVNLKFT